MRIAFLLHKNINTPIDLIRKCSTFRAGRFETGLFIRDNLTKEKVNLTTSRPHCITWYACGPTVYDSCHIGHASSYIRQDVIRRILEGQRGRPHLTVLHVMGITDIDDKIIQRANREGVAWDALSRRYEHEFIQDLTSLNIRQPLLTTRVSDYIPKIISFVQNLLNGGLAYVAASGTVYFDSEAYGRYGKLRPLTADMEEQEVNPEKKDKKDFALWKAWKPGEPSWNTPWGKGRPGWHIECSVMASDLFGQNLDLHTGGKDLLFPHHENEEAQCCARFGVRDWVNHWIHTGILSFKGDVKMSKSLGNTVSIRQFLSTHDPDSFRLFCLLSKYNKSIEYTAETVTCAKSLIDKLTAFLTHCDSVLKGYKTLYSKADESQNQQQQLWSALSSVKIKSDAALCDDFDTPLAVEILLDYVSAFRRSFSEIRSESSSSTGQIPVDFQLVLASKTVVTEFFDLLGFQFSGQSSLSKHQANENFEPVVTQLVDFRNQVRKYSLALNETDKTKRKKIASERQELIEACDKVRNQLNTFGIKVQDHGLNSSWLRLLQQGGEPKT